MKKRTTFLSKMSRVFAALLLLPAFGFLAVSCSDDEEKKDPNIIENLPGTVTITAGEASNTATLSFEALSDWSLSYVNEDSEWFTFTPENGAPGKATITFTAPYNDGAAKVGKLTLKHGTSTYTIVVNQAAGKPDMPTWDKEALKVMTFAPDAYNTTTEMPISYTISVKTIQDYSTLEEAPFDILVFSADEMGTPIDSLVDWAKIKIADNSPLANDGKKLEMTLDTIAIDGLILTKNNPRYAFICMVPKGTDKTTMFDKDGEMKDEYKAMGTSIEQKNYSVSFTGEKSQMIMDQDPSVTSTTITRDFASNCKYIIAYQDPADAAYISSSVTDNILTMVVNHTALRAVIPFSENKSMLVKFYIDRGPNFAPVEVRTQPGMSIFYIKMIM